MTDIPNESSSRWYLHHLDTHTSSSKEQILGQRSILIPNKRNPHSTIVPPSNAIWSPDEKSIFFASLRRHSRWRGDLIASEVKTKTEAEVEWYLDLLELGKEVTGEVDRRRHDEGMNKLNWDGLRSWRKGLSPASREVSEKWIEKEEDLSINVVKQIEERENDEKQHLIRKLRRTERKLLFENVDLDSNLTPYLRNKQFELHPSFKLMENQWSIDDYLTSIDSSKLSSLNNLMKPDWSNWYSDRVHIPIPSPQKTLSKEEFSDEKLDEEEVEEEEEEYNIRGKPSKGDPFGKISIDQKKYEDLITIPKKERTAEQKKQLAAITNRRRNREKYRISKLLEEGFTLMEIEAAGGADAIFASREQDENIDTTQSKKVLTKKIDTLAMVGKLRHMGMYEYLMMSGIEVFNFDMIQRVNRRIGLDEPRSISFPVLQGIHALLVSHLRQLIYNSLVIAEQAYLQQPSDEEAIPELHADHVHQALSAAGLIHPSEVISDFIERIFDTEDNDDGEQASDNDEDEELGRNSRANNTPKEDDGTGRNSTEEATPEDGVTLRFPSYRSHIHPPGDLPWHHIPLVSSTEIDVDGDDNIPDDISDAATELEDEELDLALDKMDEVHDKIYEDSLWEALKKDQVDWEDNDRGEVWTLGTDNISSQSKRNDIKAEKEYIISLLETDSARRKRKHKEAIYRRYPTTRIKKLARANKRMKSNAWIIDSDSDTEDEGEGGGYVWNGGDDSDDDIGTSDEESEEEEEGSEDNEGNKEDEENEEDEEAADIEDGSEQEEVDELEHEDGKEDEHENDELEEEDGKYDEEEPNESERAGINEDDA